ncbi:MAG: 3-hydroxyacyl-CoA dehydrogenase NAD-binding domain-containing protein [Myxococcota bacterium]
MTDRIEKAAVLGAGLMGTGIAAHLAGAGIKTLLLDIVPKDAGPDPKSRNRLANESLAKALKSKPATFFDPSAARLIQTGNFDDDLARIADCDLVIEVVVENMDIKRQLFGRVKEHLGKNAILASNTSGMKIEGMTEGLPKDLKERFIVLHFFNPVRYMRLLEIIPGAHTSEAVVARARQLGETLGKGVVFGKDTVNFIANRIGIYSIMKSIDLMQQMGLSIEEVDKIAGPPMGRPKSAAFKTADLVGIDTFLHVAKNCYDNLPEDEERDVFQTPAFIEKLVAAGATGRKAGAGFYKKVGSDVQVLDYEKGEYRPQTKVRFDSLGTVRNIEDVGERVKALLGADDKAAEFAWKATAHMLCYTARRLGEISDDIVQVDNAMRWGFNWDLGPFEMWDAIGVGDSVARMKKEGFEVPSNVIDMLESGRSSFYEGPLSTQTFYDVGAKQAAPVPQDPRHLRLAALKENSKRIVKSNLGASLVDLGDGALCLEVHTKMNTIDADVIQMMSDAVVEAENNFEALVVGNDGDHFGAGANLMLIFMAAQQNEWGQVETAISALQNALQGLKYAKVPVVAAPFQYTFGGCAEIVMACDAAEAHAETYIGLVEVGAGLVPGGGGCLRMVDRWTSPVADVKDVDLLPMVGAASLNIATAKVATGAEEGKRLRFLYPTDGVSLNRDLLLHHAKQRALGLARAGYRPPRPPVFRAAGTDAAWTIGMQVWSMVEGGYASAHDALIAKKVAHILCGGDVLPGTELTEQHYLDLEREAFLSLCGEEKTQARIQSLLMSNKPLRN